MTSLTVIHSGLFASIQDQGRRGYAFYGIPRSGHLDPYAAREASALVGNDPEWPLIECNLLPPTIRFDTDATISLAGADMKWQIDGASIERYRTHTVAAGSVLSGSYSVNGARAYLAVRGRPKCNVAYGSASTYTYAKLGGLNGERLGVGDQLHFEGNVAPAKNTGTTPVPLDYNAIDSIQFVHGPEWDTLNADAQSAFITEPFTITPDSNRMGARLSGPVLRSRADSVMRSLPVFPGVVQLPASGAPIVNLSDGQTTGGYPRVAVISEKNLAQFNQVLPGRQFYFRR